MPKAHAFHVITAFLIGVCVGASVVALVGEKERLSLKPLCRDGLVACSREDQSMELKDGYLVCRCGKKK